MHPFPSTLRVTPIVLEKVQPVSALPDSTPRFRRKSFAFAGQYLFFCATREIARQLSTTRAELLRLAVTAKTKPQEHRLGAFLLEKHR
jgi:hypothetical protein